MRNIGDPTCILDRGATSGVKPSLITHISSLITDGNTINISSVSVQALDNHSYDGLGNNK